MTINFISILAIFMISSMIGWIIEVFFRRFVSTKHWVNPGFLTGPCLPIYGFGSATMCIIINSFEFLKSMLNNEILYIFIVTIIIGLVMTVIEYIGGIIFIKGFHVKLWDYSNQPLNIQGIICPLFSLIWTLVGLFFTIFVYSPLMTFINQFINNIYVIFVLGIAYGILIIDFSISINFVGHLRQALENNKYIINFERLKLDIREKLKANRTKSHFILPFKNFNNVKDKIIEELKRNKK